MIIGLSVNTVMFIIGRVLCGISCGLGSLVIPTYLGEVSTIKARGILGSFNQFFVVSGILFSSIVGLATANVPLWRLNYAFVAIPAITQSIVMTTCVESPRWLVSINRHDEALESLQKLRGKSVNVDVEFFSILSGQLGYQRATEIVVNAPCKHSIDIIKNEEESISALKLESVPQNRQPMSIIDIFRDPVIRKITLIVLFHHSIQQLSGMNAVMFYSSVIFETALDPHTAQYMTIISSAVNFIMSIIAVALVDKKGRRLLTLVSEVGLFLFSLLLVIGYLYNLSSLLIVSVFLYVSSFALGIGPIPWLITSEMTPIYASSAVGAAATSMNWAMSFLVGQLFPVVFDAIQGWSFLIFSVICLSSIFVTWCYLPETKGRSIESIVQGFYKL
ncbi:general substrate transporter [Backusella circina FSU 941]|nr:general substrate transporter [Backusella circina FSU 941]